MIGQFTMTNGIKRVLPRGGEYADFRKEATGTLITLTFTISLAIQTLRLMVEAQLQTLHSLH